MPEGLTFVRDLWLSRTRPGFTTRCPRRQKDVWPRRSLMNPTLALGHGAVVDSSVR